MLNKTNSGFEIVRQFCVGSANLAQCQERYRQEEMQMFTVLVRGVAWMIVTYLTKQRVEL